MVDIDFSGVCPTGEGAVYSFRDLAQGSYTVRIDSDKVKADDKYWESYKSQLQKFCKKNRVNYIDMTNMPAPGAQPPQT